MSFRIFALTCVLCSTILSTALASTSNPLVVCGGSPGTASVEVDNMFVHRGGTYQNQLVLRNAAIIEDFISKQAIYRDELNSKGEFIAEGHGYPSNTSVNASVKNRNVSFVADQENYTLKISYRDSNFQQVVLANFTFKDCKVIQ